MYAHVGRLFQVKTVHTVSGRKFSLTDIRKDHLERMHKLGLLRNVDEMTDNDASAFAERHGN